MSKSQMKIPKTGNVPTSKAAAGAMPSGPDLDLDLNMEQVSNPAGFAGKQIRKILHQDVWWFSIIDVIEVLVGGDRPRKYWNDLKKKLVEEGCDELSANIGQLKMPSSDGKSYFTDCANTETLFRIIQSIPSPKVEPFKRWLAKVGKERIDEIENPELSMERMQELYEKKGYPKEWIDKRLRGISVRQDLTDEWKDRGVDSRPGFAILTNEIMHGAFGLKVDEYNRSRTLGAKTYGTT